ncbi:MAG: Na+ dependent nucleoside transporter N-terminal domain-containing protein, partial [Synechococcales cyanobacterium]
MESSLSLSPDARITVREMDFYLNLVSLFGIIALGGFTWALSENRGHIPWRTIIGGLILE